MSTPLLSLSWTTDKINGIDAFYPENHDHPSGALPLTLNAHILAF